MKNTLPRVDSKWWCPEELRCALDAPKTGDATGSVIFQCRTMHYAECKWMDNNSLRPFSDYCHRFVVSMRIVAKRLHPTAKISEEKNRKLPDRNTLV